MKLQDCKRVEARSVNIFDDNPFDEQAESEEV